MVERGWLRRHRADWRRGAAVVEAAEIYSDLSGRGILIPDADILIAASAMAHELGVATNNVEHFKRIRGLYVENWLTE